MKRLRRTKKESDASLLEKENLQVRCKISMIDVGVMHPVLHLRDFLCMLASENRLDLLTGGHGFASCSTFWERYKDEDPTHPCYRVHPHRLHSVVPMYVYGDEGTSKKKPRILILAVQPAIGKGTSMSESRSGTELGVNMLGVSYTTRFVYSVMKQGSMRRNRQDSPSLQRPCPRSARSCSSMVLLCPIRAP